MVDGGASDWNPITEEQIKEMIRSGEMVGDEEALRILEEDEKTFESLPGQERMINNNYRNLVIASLEEGGFNAHAHQYRQELIKLKISEEYGTKPSPDE